MTPDLCIVLQICPSQKREYMATIFPGNRMKMTGVIGREASIIFDGLEGGTVEYVVTGPKKYIV